MFQKVQALNYFQRYNVYKTDEQLLKWDLLMCIYIYIMTTIQYKNIVKKTKYFSHHNIILTIMISKFRAMKDLCSLLA